MSGPLPEPATPTASGMCPDAVLDTITTRLCMRGRKATSEYVRHSVCRTCGYWGVPWDGTQQPLEDALHAWGARPLLEVIDESRPQR